MNGQNNMIAKVRFVFVEFDVHFASLVEGPVVADIGIGEGNTTTWKMCKKAELSIQEQINKVQIKFVEYVSSFISNYK